MLAIVRAAILRHDSLPAAFSVANSRHLRAPWPPFHWTRAFRALQATHSPSAQITDGLITPHVEQSHAPDPSQCQHVAGCRKTSKMAGFASRTRASNSSSRARRGLRQRVSPSTATLTPRPRSSVRISAAWVIGAPCRRCSRPQEPQSNLVFRLEPELTLSFQ